MRVVLVPVKSFRRAKERLAPVLDAEERAQLVRDLATRVIAAAAPLPVAVVCDDEEVADFVGRLGAQVLWTPGLGLSGAVASGIEQLAAAGADVVTVAHGDLPLACDLSSAGRDAAGGGSREVTLVPDRRLDGTNVATVPAAAGFVFAYGPGSFARHRAEAARVGLPCRILHDFRLATDVDLPEDSRARAGSGLTVEANLPLPQRALAVGAHPDDIEFGCGATLAKWAAAGCAIHHLVCTDGSKGSWDHRQDPAELVAIRQGEQRAASRALGGQGEVVFLGWPDGELESGLRQRWEICAWIRRIRPDVVLGHDPWARWRLHPDHRNAGFLVTDGIVAARDPHFFPEQDADPHRPSALLLFESEEPDHVEDVGGFEAAKVAALLEHRSQFRSTMDIDAEADGGEAKGIEDFRRRVFDRLAENGLAGGVTAGELFKRIDC